MKPGKTFYGKALIVTGALLLLLSQSAPSQAAPTLDFATYLGGGVPYEDFSFNIGGLNYAAMDNANAIALDDAGNVYVAGSVWSVHDHVPPGGSSTGDFPYTHRIGDRMYWDVEIFLSKFSPTGELLASVHIGGRYQEEAKDIAVDASGNIYLTGWTGSDNFPLLNEYQSDRGPSDYTAFITKLDPDFNLLYSTYLGGTSVTEGLGIAVDDAGHAYVTGSTRSTDFPTKGAFMFDSDGYVDDGWVAKFNTNLAGEDSLIYSTYLDGSNYGRANKIACDSAGHAYVVGATKANDFPLRNEYTGYPGGCFNVFVAKLNPAGDDLLYSTYLGRTNEPNLGDIAATDDGHVYVTGNTSWDLFPTRHAYQDDLHGDEVFLTRLNTNLAGDASLVYSTFLGGTFIDGGFSIAADPTGKVYITGRTNSPDFPLRDSRPPSVSGDFDIFLAKFNTALTGDDSLVFSTYFGGTAEDSGKAVAIGDPTGGLAIAGVTLSPDLPVTPGAFQNFLANTASYDAFVMKWSEPADIAIPFPGGPSITYYPPLAFSVLRPGPSECQPLGAVQISRSTLHAQAALPKFQAPANLYLALYGSDEPIPGDGSNNQNLPPLNEMYFLNDQGELVAGMTPWMTGVTEPVSQLLAVDVQALQIDEPYLNLAVIARAPLSQVDQVMSVMNQFNGYYAWITQVPVPRNQLGETLLSLQTLLATNQVAKDKTLQQAIACLQNSLNPEYWLDPWTLDDELGREALKDQEKAVQKLMQTKSQHQDITQGMADILEVNYTLATCAIVDAIALGGEPLKINKAREKLIKAGKELADEDFRSALHYYELAWTQAEKAW